MSLPRIALLPTSASLAGAAAEHLLAHHPAPDLTGAVCVLPGGAAMGALRASLAAQTAAVLGPQLFTLAGFAERHGDEPPGLSALDCRLILAEALSRHPDLFAGQNLWALTDALFALFEELAGERAPIDARALAGRLRRGYGATEPLESLSREAHIVHALWQAFEAETGGRSPASRRVRNLRAAFARFPADQPLYLIGLDDLAATECAAVRAALARPTVHLWLSGRLDGRDGEALAALCARLGVAPEPVRADADARSQVLDAVYAAGGPPLAERARAARAAPLPIRVTPANSPEQEARCAELAVRRFLVDGARHVGVVCDDRRLARRVRALLERSGVPLDDSSGWALSTSRAAATLSAWLDLIEQKGHFRPLLELLKSAAFAGEAAAVQRLERDVIHRRLCTSVAECVEAARGDAAVGALLERCAAALRRADRYRHEVRRLPQWIADVTHAAQHLGLWEAWQADAAGVALVACLETLSDLAQRRALALDWAGFRRFLDGVLERTTFVPGTADSPVRLLTADEACLARFDAVVITGASAGGLPGPPPGEPFFNQAVRAELGLVTWSQRRALRLARLRALLESAPRVHVTYSADHDDEEPLPSPWIEALQSFAHAATGDDLADAALNRLAGGADAEPAVVDGAVPAPAARPQPQAPPDLVPASISANTHQALIDCPYRFYAKAVLGLRKPEEPDEPRTRRDYGMRVHDVLHRFTDGYAQHPPAAGADELRAWVVAELDRLAQDVMAGDLARSIIYTTWLAEFRRIVPALADWLVERHSQWTESHAEVELTAALEGVGIHGRMDRVDRAHGAAAVADYKTGQTSSGEDVRTGEAVQLAHYALLVPGTRRAELLDLKDVRPMRVQEGEALAQLAQDVAQRLVAVFRQIRASHALPAWGDEVVCDRCEYMGLCRKGTWSAEAPAAPAAPQPAPAAGPGAQLEIPL